MATVEHKELNTRRKSRTHRARVERDARVEHNTQESNTSRTQNTQHATCTTSPRTEQNIHQLTTPPKEKLITKISLSPWEKSMCPWIPNHFESKVEKKSGIPRALCYTERCDLARLSGSQGVETREFLVAVACHCIRDEHLQFAYSTQLISVSALFAIALILRLTSLK